ncbi:MAG: hypothetical protein A2455_16505 [Ignavibacteria bacterium RIFOXYC2_FULL_35_16]|nr:MAG: hypothetical protein A2455_16505 [Ignavibacteria bacterium RIFOXYC2_FULL_35_16]
MFIKIIQLIDSYSIQMLVINLLRTYTFKFGKSNRICEIKHSCDIETSQLQCTQKFGRQPIKLNRKKTIAEEDVELN